MDSHVKLQLLAAAAWMDGSIEVPERELLDELAGRLGLKSADVDTILDGLRTGQKIKIRLSESEDPMKRSALLQQVCALLAADGDVTERELSFAMHVGASLAIGSERVNNTVQTALAHHRAAEAIAGDSGRSLSQLINTLARVLDKI